MGLKQHNDVANYKYQAGDICVIEYTIHEQGDNVAQLHSIIRAEFETQGLRFSNDTFTVLVVMLSVINLYTL